MRGQRSGSLVAAGFGLVYVLVNSGPLPDPIGYPLRILGCLACVAIVIAVARPRPVHETAAPGPDQPFNPVFWVVVALEALAIAAGLVVLNGPLDLPRAGVAWVSFVVGAHFFALARVFGERFFNLLGAVIGGCGLIGLIAAAAGVGTAPVALISGVVPGLVLLASGWWGATRQ